MHRLSSVAVLAVVSLAFPSSALPGQDPTATNSGEIAPQQFTLYLERDGTRTATFIEPRADGMVAFRAPDGTVDHVPVYRVRRVTNQYGADVTRSLRRREWLGTPPPKPEKPVNNEPWKSYRFRSGPGTVCGSYLITDFAEMPRLGVGTYENQEERFYESIDLGYAKNFGPASSLGGTLFFGADGARAQAGLRLRVSRWLSPRTSLDFAPGIILVANEEGNSQFHAPGFAGQVGLMVGGRFGATLQVFSAKRTALGYNRSVTENACHFGLRLGAGPGIAGSAMFLVAGLSTLGNGQFSPSVP